MPLKCKNGAFGFSKIKQTQLTQINLISFLPSYAPKQKFAACTDRIMPASTHTVKIDYISQTTPFDTNFGPGRQVPKCHCRFLLLVGISSLASKKIPKAFLIHSGAQRNLANTFVVTLPTDLPSQIFHLFSH